MSKRLVRTDTKPPTVDTPSLRLGDFVLLNEGVSEYITGGRVRGFVHSKPSRVMQFSPSKNNILLSRPVGGWVGVDQVTKVGSAAATPRQATSPTPVAKQTRIKAEELEILLPVTRPWACERMTRALSLSDIPRGKIILIIDNSGCEDWKPALERIGFTVDEHFSHKTEPPKGRVERRKRHRQMRRLSQKLVGDGPLLLLEDDTLVPRDVFSRLERTEGSVSGIQVARHDDQLIHGVHGWSSKNGIVPIDSCGHYCMLTTGKAYKAAKVLDDDEAVDIGHTRQIRPLYADWDVVCGHLLENGQVITPGDKRIEVRPAIGPMHLGAYVHMYPPHHNAGAEHMLHAILSEAVRQGHKATVVVSKGRKSKPVGIGSYTIDGVRVSEDLESIRGVEFVLTHLDRTFEAEAWCTANKIPCVQLFHNHYQTKLARVCDLAVYNTHWLADAFPSPFPSVVVHPPVDMDHYRVTPGDAITLINLSAAKGANIFYGLAEAFPKLLFLGVAGAYGEQILRDDLPNVEIVECQSDIREVYKRTRVLLVPSVYESYGRVAVEASASGIPVIANPTPGLLEAIGSVGVFPKRIEPLLMETAGELSIDNLPAWKKALQTTLKSWDAASERASRLEVDPKAEVCTLLGALQVIRR